ncbi:hypothetical protein E2P63_00570 [Candidatus Bathyarchaeota archaeon]|nr:hypothetical protein E2P63_00570 [Candidatus Bathyarchaeota archaeon]
MNRRTSAIFGTLLLLLAPHFSSTIVSASSPIVLESLTLTTYLDGFILVSYKLTLNQTFPSVNVTLLGETHENLLVIDEQSLPLEYAIVNAEIIIYSLNASQIQISYSTSDLTMKTGKYWTLTAQVPTSTKVILPENASIISLNNVPELIESSNNQVTVVMPTGTIEITYITEHSLQQQTQDSTPWSLIVAVISFPLIACIAFALWSRKRKLPPQQKEIEQEVDVDKLFEREKYLRPEEVQVIHFLAEKHGTTFEAELYEMLNLPRTTTWRLLKRMEKMEIVDIRKSRRQNVVSIRKKYMKK